MNELKIFENEDFGTIRTVEIDNEPWFVGKDVARALGYKNPQKALRDHVDKEDRTANEKFTVNGTALILINETGLYSLILSSKLPSVKKFKRWVTAEVLPAIRTKGRYVIDTYHTNLSTKERIQIARLITFAPASRLKALRATLQPIIGDIQIEEETTHEAYILANADEVLEVISTLITENGAVVKRFDDNTYALDRDSFKQAMQNPGFTYKQALKVLDEAGHIKRATDGKRTCPVYANGSRARCVIFKM